METVDAVQQALLGESVGPGGSLAYDALQEADPWKGTSAKKARPCAAQQQKPRADPWADFRGKAMPAAGRALGRHLSEPEKEPG